MLKKRKVFATTLCILVASTAYAVIEQDLYAANSYLVQNGPSSTELPPDGTVIEHIIELMKETEEIEEDNKDEKA